ncbi:MAG: LacI family DNA-binding transcriptional regulator [Georgenia sp.]
MDFDQRPTRATLETVARAAGVSKATVSKVLNDRPGVAVRTRVRVKEALRDLGYEPSTGPRSSASPTVVNVVFNTMMDVYAGEVLNGILTAARDAKLEVVVDVLGLGGASSEGEPLSPEWIRAIASKNRLGVLVVTAEPTAAQVDLFREADLHIVTIGPLNTGHQNAPSVASTNFAGGVQATTHLLDLGHRRIAFAGGPRESLAASERFNGYCSALDTAGLTMDTNLVIHGAFTYGGGLAMGLALLGRNDPPTGIVAGSDASALGIYQAARRLGVAIPADVSVVGFDDTSAALSSAPPLTTVRQPIALFGRVALRMLVEMAHGQPPPSRDVRLSTRLVTRESTAPPRDSR